MPLQPLLETPGLLISYDVANDWLYVSWLGDHDQESARACCEQIHAVFQQYPTSKVLNDNSNVLRAAASLTPWGIQWLQQLYTLGLRYVAWVYAPDFPGREPSEMMIKYLDKPVIVAFDDVATAHDWLQRQRLPSEGPGRQ